VRLLILILAVILMACAPVSQPPPTATSIVSTPTPAVTPVPTLDAASTDTQYAFLSNVNDLTSDIEALSLAQCADLTAEIRNNPTEVTEMRGFAATFQRLGTSQPVLSSSSDVRSSLEDLGKALMQLDNALSTCGIKTP
jgi:hypothetical protein